jgi:ABC-type Fe3+ transport system permease subunit
VVVAIVLALGPILVFAVSLAGGRYTITQSFAEAFCTIRVAGVPTLMVAACAGLAGVAVAVALLDEPRWPRPLRFASAATTGIVVLVAILPPPLIGTSVASFFSSEIIGNAKHWNIYDNTPVTWVAAMLARFAFVPVCLAQLLNRRIPGELADQALSDGANRIERLTCARLPLMWRPLAAAGVAVAGLSLSEVAAAGLVQPPQWIGGSLAVYIDSQMHYGRHNQTIALSLIMVGGAVMAGLVLPLIARRR